MKKIIVALLVIYCGLISVDVLAQSDDSKFSIKFNPEVHGVLYTRYEYHTSYDHGQRFQVRNARLSAKGELNNYLDYLFQYEFSDEGTAKIVDAYVRLKPLGNNSLAFTLGQMRAPFTIDAHRGPDKQYFNNRSFIAKFGGVRDLGFMGEYNFTAGVPMTIQAGVYNGDAFSHQKELRKSFMMYQVKYQAQLSDQLYFSASHRSLRPGEIREAMWDGGFRWSVSNFMLEAEYMLQTYSKSAFKKVHYVNAFFNYDIQIDNPGLSKISFLGRYDYMTDYSNGLELDAASGKLALTSSRRSRATAGMTISIAKKAFTGDIRINYEKYFYGKNPTRPKYENDRVVVGFVVSF